MDAFLKDLKHSLRISAQPGVHAGRRRGADARHRRQHRDLLGGQRRAAAAGRLPGSDRIVMFMNTSPQGSGPAASPAKFMHWRGAGRRRAGRLGVQHRRRELHRRQLPGTAALGAGRADFFRLFGAPFVQGRDVPRRRGSARTGRRVVVLSHGLWATRFNSDPADRRQGDLARRRAVHDRRRARRLRLRATSVRAPQVWMPFQLDPNTTDQGHYFQSAGRLKPGVTLEQAQGAASARPPKSSSASIPNCARPEPELQRRADQRTCSCATCARRCSCWLARSASCC